MDANRIAAVGVVATLLLVGSTGPAAAAQQPTFVVELDDRGDAAVTITYTYDLGDDAEQAAFAELQRNETATAAFEDRVHDRFERVANASENQTGRQMGIESAAVELTREDRTGVVEVSVQWNGLAATTEDGLVLDEPFASGFEPDRAFVVVLPDGYEATAVTPSPAESGDGRLEWAGGTALDDFEVVATAEPSADTDAATDADGPGFGVGGAVAALAATSLLALRRRSGT
ncbi:PGF-CTERM sorting domain-containing protein [Halomicrobium mukohataei]|uniref:PGF-CTERM sorting domain-containing protein n=1 Tax=Halomicrobium mukohataei TaxID=57705 RepID=A0A847TT24_9EURY|nr:PGF-CTERM sorting domain-containing protein [Halomicrobium mukohataei]NLV09192.1 PGF-CTERM sorting domain-containing protein [Halomicrobium mukohataei]